MKEREGDSEREREREKERKRRRLRERESEREREFYSLILRNAMTRFAKNKRLLIESWRVEIKDVSHCHLPWSFRLQQRKLFSEVLPWCLLV